MKARKIEKISVMLITMLMISNVFGNISAGYPGEWDEMTAEEIAIYIKNQFPQTPWNTSEDPPDPPLKSPVSTGSRPLLYEPPWDVHDNDSFTTGGGIGWTHDEAESNGYNGTVQTIAEAGPGIGGYGSQGWISHGFWFEAPVQDIYEITFEYYINGWAIGLSVDSIIPPGSGFAGVDIYLNFEVRTSDHIEVLINEQTIPFVYNFEKYLIEEIITYTMSIILLEGEVCKIDAVALAESVASGVGIGAGAAEGYIADHPLSPTTHIGGKLLSVSVNWPNHPPETPEEPDGPSEGTTGIEYTYSTEADDPDGDYDSLHYKWDWGNEISGWDGPYDPGEEIEACHIWTEENDYEIRVKAKDTCDEESDWSPPKTVTISLPDTNPPDTWIVSGPLGSIDYNDFTFTWSGSDDETPTENLEYKYMLEGYDSSWSNWISYTSKDYNDVPDGGYTFKVKARDENQNEDPSPATRSFTIDTNPQVDGDWSMFRHDLQNKGYSTSTAPDTNNILWQSEYSNGVTCWDTSSPSIYNNRIYIGYSDASDEKVGCFNADNGDLIWEYITGGGMDSSPTVANGAHPINPTDGF